MGEINKTPNELDLKHFQFIMDKELADLMELAEFQRRYISISRTEKDKGWIMTKKWMQ